MPNNDNFCRMLLRFHPDGPQCEVCTASRRARSRQHRLFYDSILFSSCPVRPRVGRSITASTQARKLTRIVEQWQSHSVILAVNSETPPLSRKPKTCAASLAWHECTGQGTAVSLEWSPNGDPPSDSSMPTAYRDLWMSLCARRWSCTCPGATGSRAASAWVCLKTDSCRKWDGHFGKSPLRR